LDNDYKRTVRALWLLVGALAATLVAAVAFAPKAHGDKLVVEDGPVLTSTTVGETELGPCWTITEEVNWTQAPRGRRPESGEAHALDLNVTFYETQEELESLQLRLFGYKVVQERKRSVLYGFTYVRQSTPGVCYVATLRPDRVDSRNMCWLGHEVMHCIAGDYHR
jgi:hypothetical protein